MKKIVFFVFTILCLTSAHAQVKGSGVEFGFGVDAGVPVGNDLNKYSSMGFGGDVTLGYNFNAKTALLVRGGYMTFLVDSKYHQDKLKAFGDGSAKVCGRYNFPGRFYVEPQFGFTSFSTGASKAIKAGQGLTYAAAAGVFLDKLKAFDLSVRYEGTFTNNGINFVAVRFAYSLKPGSFF